MYKLTILFLFLSACLSAVEYSYLEPDTELTLQAGDIFEILSFEDESLHVTQQVGDISYAFSWFELGVSGNSGATSRSRIFCGPATLTVTHFVNYKLTRASELAQSSTPVNTVVIPTDANGNVEIILESSTDLVNWTAASPGEYSSATQNRFFRVRAVVTGD